MVIVAIGSSVIDTSSMRAHQRISGGVSAASLSWRAMPTRRRRAYGNSPLLAKLLTRPDEP